MHDITFCRIFIFFAHNECDGDGDHVQPCKARFCGVFGDSIVVTTS